MDTIRDEIAACMEKSFDKIQLNEAAKMLSISSSNSMKEYAKKVLFKDYLISFQSAHEYIFLQRDWVLKPGDFYAFQIDVKKTDDALAALDLAKQAVEYARELEMIV